MSNTRFSFIESDNENLDLSLFSKRRKKSQIQFENDLSQNLSDCINNYFQDLYKTTSLSKSKARLFREKCQNYLIQKCLMLEGINHHDKNLIKNFILKMEYYLFDHFFLEDINFYTSSIRRLCRYFFIDPLKFMSHFSPSYISTMSNKDMILFLKQNSSFNLDNKSLITISSIELDINQKKEYQKLIEEKSQISVFKNAESEVTCNRCGSKKVDSEERQMRRGDEGANIFFTCRSCHHRWKT